MEQSSIEQIAQAITDLAERGEDLVKQSGLYPGRHRRFLAAFEGIEDLAGEIMAELRMPHTERL